MQSELSLENGICGGGHLTVFSQTEKLPHSSRNEKVFLKNFYYLGFFLNIEDYSISS